EDELSDRRAAPKTDDDHVGVGIRGHAHDVLGRLETDGAVMLGHLEAGLRQLPASGLELGGVRTCGFRRRSRSPGGLAALRPHDDEVGTPQLGLLDGAAQRGPALGDGDVPYDDHRHPAPPRVRVCEYRGRYYTRPLTCRGAGCAGDPLRICPQARIRRALWTTLSADPGNCGT